MAWMVEERESGACVVCFVSCHPAGHGGTKALGDFAPTKDGWKHVATTNGKLVSVGLVGKD